jgi:predicted aspartyl protease
MQVGVMVDGKGPFRFFVDSGADRSVIGFALAERLGLPAGPDVLLHSTGSAQKTHTVHIDTLQVGTSRIHDIAAPALPERFLGGDGMLGIDALIDQRLTIDFDKKNVVVQDTHARDTAAGPDEVVIVARRRKGQLILTQAYAARTRIAAVIDTGTEITVGNSALRAKLMRSNRAPVMTTTLISVTGDEVPADLLPVPEIRIGDLTLHNVLIAFSDMPPFKLFGLENEPAILLGSDILSSFRKVSLDFRRRKVRFTLRPGS